MHNNKKKKINKNKKKKIKKIITIVSFCSSTYYTVTNKGIHTIEREKRKLAGHWKLVDKLREKVEMMMMK